MVVVLVNVELTVPLVAVGGLDFRLGDDNSAVVQVPNGHGGNWVVEGIRAAIVSPPLLHRPNIKAARVISTVRVGGGEAGIREGKLEGSLIIAVLGVGLELGLEGTDDLVGFLPAAALATGLAVLVVGGDGEEAGSEGNEGGDKVHLL